MKNLKLLFLALPLFLISCSMSSDFELAFNPPLNTDTAYEIFPENIGGNPMKLNKLEFGGMEGMYGNTQSIYVARLNSNEEALAFFKKNLLPDFTAQSSNFSATVNGQFYAKASGSSQQLFGWINQNFAFMIKAGDKKELDQIVESFNFIALK